MLSNLARRVSKQDTEAGTYKGQLFITEFDEARQKEYDEFRQEAMSLLHTMINKGKVHMYLYIIEAANLPKKDAFSNSDPFLIVKSGK